jgi:hypothetical protein
MKRIYPFEVVDAERDARGEKIMQAIIGTEDLDMQATEQAILAAVPDVTRDEVKRICAKRIADLLVEDGSVVAAATAATG